MEPAELRRLKVSGIPPPHRPSVGRIFPLEKEVICMIYKRPPIVRNIRYAHSSRSPGNREPGNKQNSIT